MRLSKPMRYIPAMGLLVAALGFGLASMLLIESIPRPWRKAIGGAILIAALLLGLGSDH
jgi:ribose/xylose/arabinose/galactoside ABC-type transport system permease subunit